MHFIERFTRWEGIVFGFIIGVTATVVGSMAYNEINGTLRVSHLKRSLHNNQLAEIAALLEGELATASTAMKDGQPIEISNYFAFHFMPKLYAHHMDYAMTFAIRPISSPSTSRRETSPGSICDSSIWSGPSSRRRTSRMPSSRGPISGSQRCLELI